MYSVLYKFPEVDTSRTTIYDQEIYDGQMVKPLQTIHNVAY